MTGITLTAEIRRQTSTSTTTMPDATLLPIVNFVKDELATRLTMKDENYFVLPALFDLVVSTINAREYALPADILNNLASVEIAFDGTKSPLAYVTAKKISLQKAIKITGGLTEANIINNFTNTEPYYVQYRNSIYILSASIVAVTSGGKIRYRSWPADLANLTGIVGLEIDPTTTTFGTPRALHRDWARGVAIEIKQGKIKPVPLNDLDKSWDKDVMERISEISQEDLSEEITGLLPNTTREGNNGRDL